MAGGNEASCLGNLLSLIVRGRWSRTPPVAGNPPSRSSRSTCVSRASVSTLRPECGGRAIRSSPHWSGEQSRTVSSLSPQLAVSFEAFRAPSRPVVGARQVSMAFAISPVKRRFHRVQVVENSPGRL